MMKKRWAAGFVTVMLIMTMSGMTALAAEPGQNADGMKTGGICSSAAGLCRYVDTNQDGVCDTMAARHGYGNCSCSMDISQCEYQKGICHTEEDVCAYVDADGDGVCDNHGGACGYVDADGDGVCDNHGDTCAHVDADGDGICDTHGSACAYVDTDGDGVCDLQNSQCVTADGTNCSGAGTVSVNNSSRSHCGSSGHGHRQGHHGCDDNNSL